MVFIRWLLFILAVVVNNVLSSLVVEIIHSRTEKSTH